MTTPYPTHPQLSGNYAPLRMECDLHDLVVEGEIPRELVGTYYRNGPDPQYPPRGEHHWFAGDGMVHAWRIEEGRVSYRNRWVRTKKWQLERAAKAALMSPFDPRANDPSVVGVEMDGLANTNIVWHGGKLLALEEAHPPFELERDTLDSKGAWTFGGRYDGPMTAHPKMDPETGEMLFFGYNASGPFSAGMTYQVVDAKGNLVRQERFDAPYSSMVHDFITTQEHVIFPIFPLTGSLARAMQGQPPFAWEPELGTRIGVMRRDGSVADIRWFETDACYVFHPMNAYTDGNRIVAHVMQFEEAPLFPRADGTPGDPSKARARLAEWVIDLGDNSRGVARRYLDDLTGEFPRLDERHTGLGYRLGFYAASTRDRERGASEIGFDTLVRHDFMKGNNELYQFAAGEGVGEPVFVPRAPDSPEGDGYLVSVVYRGRENRSDLAIFDAQRVSAGPIALAQLPHRVPYGFHGNWRAAS